MTIENYTTDINIDKSIVDTGETNILLDKDLLTGESLEKYVAFTERFGDKKYKILNTPEIEVTRFTISEVQDKWETLDYDTMSTEDITIINNFLTLLT